MIKYIFTALGIGVISGYLNHMYGSAIINGAISDYLFNGLLIALLFVMGIAFGSDKESLDKLKKASLKVLIIPFSVALGSILGGLIGGVILGIEVVSSMAICAGYG
jgi:uncharacterized membrane protein YbjE (DUF340 family)